MRLAFVHSDAMRFTQHILWWRKKGLFRIRSLLAWSRQGDKFADVFTQRSRHVFYRRRVWNALALPHLVRDMPLVALPSPCFPIEPREVALARHRSLEFVTHLQQRRHVTVSPEHQVRHDQARTDRTRDNVRVAQALTCGETDHARHNAEETLMRPGWDPDDTRMTLGWDPGETRMRPLWVSDETLIIGPTLIWIRPDTKQARRQQHYTLLENQILFVFGGWITDVYEPPLIPYYATNCK